MQQDNHDLPIYSRPARAARLLDQGLSTLWSRAKNDPTFPQPIKLGVRTTVFKTAELLAWAESKAQGVK